jgi:two-component system chemotaxis response regulator CheY
MNTNIAMATEQAQPLKILIIDDDSQILHLLRSALLQNGYHNVVTASNAKDGTQQFSSIKPDVTFLDINLPDTDGLTLLTQLLEKNYSAKIVMISADSFFDNVKRALDLGAKGFVVKPFTIKKILDAIQK